MSPTYPSHVARAEACEPADPANTVTERLNQRLANGGDGFVLSLCPSTQYLIQDAIAFAAPNQEISTLGHPTDSTRATLVVNGPVQNGEGHTTAIDGTCANCDGVKLRHIQIDGTRRGAPQTAGGGNIEMGGDNSDQLIEFVHTFDPRGWSCLHIAEGPFTCNNAIIQNNEIGPAGSSNFQQWADGISLSCQNSIVRNNMINNPTDGGIVLFGAPGSQVYNNTIWVEKQTLLGGINMVDYDPWQGSYKGTVVYNNTILGAFSDETPEAGQKDGEDSDHIMIKIGIAIGPRTWFGDKYGLNVVTGGTVKDNVFAGAFGYAMAVGSATDFTIQNNVLDGNSSFIGANGPNCSTDADFVPPKPAAFVFDKNGTSGMNIQSDFEQVESADGLTCVMPPDDGDFWPFGGNPSSSQSSSGGSSSSNGSAQHGLSGGAKAGVAIGVLLGVAALGVVVFFVARAARRRQMNGQQRSMSPNEMRSLRGATVRASG